MSEFDDARLREAMRAFLDASDALDAAANDSAADQFHLVIDSADSKALAAMALRRRLEDAGWTAPRERAESARADNSD